MAKRLLTLAELADYLDVFCGDLCELIEDSDDGSLPAVRIGDEWYVPLEDVPDWLLRLPAKKRT